MTETKLSLRKNLRNALDALEYEHASEMLSPRHKRYVLNNDKQAKVSLLKHKQALDLMQRLLSRFYFIFNPVTILKNRVVSLRAYSNRQ